MATSGWKDVTSSDIQRLQARGSAAPPKPSKYRNVKCMIGNVRFDSKHEADTWLQLKAREQAGEIDYLALQVRFPLHVTPIDADADMAVRIEVCEYVADFVFCDRTQGGKRVVMDAKGQKKRICPYPLKKKMMLAEYGIEIVEV